MRKITLVIFLIGTLSAFSQKDSTYSGYKNNKSNKDVVDFWDKTYAGGDIMLYGGTGGAYVNLSPLFGIRHKNGSFSYGAGLTYQYTSINDYYYGKLQYSLYGLRGFARQQLGKLFFIHGEYENYFTSGINIVTGQRETIIIPCANAFVGYKQNFSDYSYYYLMIGYEFIGDNNALYAYPLHPLLFKVGYIFDIRGK